MSTFIISVEKVSPLQIQIGTPSTCAVEVRGWSAWAEASVGSTSHPHFYRPSIPGTARLSAESNRVGSLNQPGRYSQCQVISSFSTNPSYPDVIPMRTNLPFRLTVDFPPKQGIIILPDSYGCLYAKTDFIGQSATKAAQTGSATPGGFLWNASVIWEEL
jgi:hypothetical protein